jgi:hypothetical protein
MDLKSQTQQNISTCRGQQDLAIKDLPKAVISPLSATMVDAGPRNSPLAEAGSWCAKILNHSAHSFSQLS